MGYDAVHKRLFRAPYRKVITPEVVARRVARLLPRGQYQHGRKMARLLAKTRLPVEWQCLDRLSELIEWEGQVLHGAGHPAPDVGDLVEALLWRGWQYQNHDDQTTTFQPLCSYCHRPAVRITRYRNQTARVCPHHLPGTKGWHRAARLRRWAGGVIALREKVMNEVVRLRAEATDQELEAVVADPNMDIDEVTLAWWKKQPDLELPIRIAAHQAIEKQYRLWVDDSRIAGGKRGGPKGGRPKMIDGDKISRAQLMISNGSSHREAARAVGMSPSTLSRRLRASVH